MGRKVGAFLLRSQSVPIFRSSGVAGTRLIAFVPERLARRCAGPLGLVIVGVDWEPPELVEAAHWHPGRSAGPALPWLRGILRKVSSALESAPGDHAELSA